MEQFAEKLVDQIRDAGSESPLRIRGGGTKDFYGGPLIGDVLDTSSYRGIVAYEPTELFLTARCGTPLSDIQTTLAEHGQMLAFEPPHFGASATLGGCVASGLSGPRRAQAGAVRDYMLGVKLLDGEGRTLNFGGQVMKNVAGYDVSRLLCGSLGTLGVLLEVSIKVLPKPVAEITLQLPMSGQDALMAMNRLAGQPLPISASAWFDGNLRLRLSGAAAAVDAASVRMGGELMPALQAEAFWNGIREQSDPFFSGRLPLWRLSVPSAAAPLGIDCTQLIEWGGAQRWLRSEEEPSRMRQLAATAGGHASLFRGAGEQQRAAGVFHPPPPPLMSLNRCVKHALDPRGIFAPSRMFPDL